jgi:hypothetical protein
MADIRPTSPEGVILAIAALIADRAGRVRVAVDGAPAADSGEVADRLVVGIAPRRALHVRSDAFWRAASLRLEKGRHDSDAWLESWLDVAALRREVLDDFPATGRVLPALRDPVTDRSLRLAPVDLPSDGVVVVSGAALLGRGLPFDIVVHLRLSPAALERRTPAAERWILPALARYAAESDPEGLADLVVRTDDPRHPALVFPTGRGGPSG